MPPWERALLRVNDRKQHALLKLDVVDNLLFLMSKLSCHCASCLELLRSILAELFPVQAVDSMSLRGSGHTTCPVECREDSVLKARLLPAGRHFQLTSCPCSILLGSWFFSIQITCPTDQRLVMVALCNRADHYIFALWFLSSIFFFLA